jgi:hypothetical protein
MPLEVTVAGQEFESRLDEGLRIERDEIGLVAVVETVLSVWTAAPALQRI